MIIVLDGINGCGKSTIAKMLVDILPNKYTAMKPVVLRDPGSTPAGEAIRKLVKDPDLPLTTTAQVLLFTAARNEMLSQVNEYVELGHWVIIDRWWYSTYAYQTLQGADEKLVFDLNERCGKLPHPNHAYFLDVFPEVAAHRRAAMRADLPDRFEMKDLPFQRKLRSKYYELVELGFMTKVHGEDPPDEIAKRIAAHAWGVNHRHMGG